MKCIIFANGEYGLPDSYHNLINEADFIICADGGANYAYELGLTPQLIIGDMDSIHPEVRRYYLEKGVSLKKYPRRKDFTDMELALEFADRQGAGEIIFMGSLGLRLDHTLSNLYCGMNLARKGKKIIHYTPACTVYLISGSLRLEGRKGQLVSILALTDQAVGVYARGFEYPLEDALLEKENPVGISNVLTGAGGEIGLKAGVLAVIHYHGEE